MKYKLIITVLLITLAGCSSQQTAPVDSIAKLPVIRVGDEAPKDTEYVVFYPAGYTFPVKLSTSGSLFSTEYQFKSKASLTKDLYLYKYWASHDGKIWKNAHQLLNVEFGGGFDVSGLRSNIKLETK